jgi:uncharacterized membrane protein
MDAREPRPVRTGAYVSRPQWRRRARTRASARRARGSIASIAALALVVAVAALGVLDVANYYLARRSLQNVADLAALAAVQQMDDACQQPPVTALANAASNGFTVSSTQTLSTVCGRWDSSGSGMAFTQASNPPTTAQLPLNGVIVTASETVPYFFVGPARPLQASATAKATVVDSFSVGTTLAQVNLLNGLLSGLLGTSVNLSVASWNGLANTNIKIGDLVAQAGAGTVNGLLGTSVNMSDLLKLMLGALQTTSVVNADLQDGINGLSTLVAANILGGQLIPLGAQGSSPGLITLGLSDSQAALNAVVSPLQLLLVAAEIAQTGQPPIGLNLNLNGLSSLLPANLQVNLQVISPPTVAIGEAGINPATGLPRTQATNAQVALSVLVSAGTEGLVTVQLPLGVQVAQATASLESAQCAPTAATSSVTISAQPGVVDACIGTPQGGAVSQTQALTCQPAQLASINLGSLQIASITSNLTVNGQIQSASTLTFNGSGVGPSNSVNSNDVGAVLTNILTTLNTELASGTGLNITVFNWSLGPLDMLAAMVTGALTNLLSPVLTALSQLVLMPLLQLLGVQIGSATVTDFPLSCGVAQLVK